MKERGQETWLDKNGGKIVIGVFALVMLLAVVCMFYPLQQTFIGWQIYTAPLWSKIVTGVGFAGFWIYAYKIHKSETEFTMGSGFLLFALMGIGLVLMASNGEYREEVPASVEKK